MSGFRFIEWLFILMIYILDTLHTRHNLGPGNYSSYTATLYFFLYGSGQSWNGTTYTQYMNQNRCLFVVRCRVNYIYLMNNNVIFSGEKLLEWIASQEAFLGPWPAQTLESWLSFRFSIESPDLRIWASQGHRNVSWVTSKLRQVVVVVSFIRIWEHYHMA